jgi:hypothetical protein
VACAITPGCPPERLDVKFERAPRSAQHWRLPLIRPAIWDRSATSPHWGAVSRERGRTVGNSAEFWMNLPAHYGFEKARQSLKPEDAGPVTSRRAA